MAYVDRIRNIRPFAFDSVVESARIALPENVRRKPWAGLEHGIVPLDTEQKLDQYLAAYGRMHLEKIAMTFNSLENPTSDLQDTVSIVDWGCGQALATCAFFDWLRANNMNMSIVRNVHLIEPSQLALERAGANVEQYKEQYGIGFEVRMIRKQIEAVLGRDIKTCGAKTTLHLFSNILDVQSLDIDFLSEFVTHSFTGRQIFCCVSPLNSGSSRIMEFAKKFGISEENILSCCTGRLKQQRGTVSMLTFVIDEGVAHVRCGTISPTPIETTDDIQLQRILKRYAPKPDVLDRVVQFYQMITELEQVKEPEVKRAVPFVFTEEGNTLKVSFKDNISDTDDEGKATVAANECRSFVEDCKINADRQRTRWPKDLYFTLDVNLDGKINHLLCFVKPFDELGCFNFESGAISLQLRDFSVGIGCAESLQLADEKVNELERFLHSDDISLGALERRIKEIVDPNAVLDVHHINVALCDKVVALSQICSELKKLNADTVKRTPLLEAFLENAELENTIDTVPQEGLISIVPMDESQRAAVAHALNNRVSVVVGPPGCGKTQLLLNLLANALVHGKKVIVASKNNKAVDNVKDRFRMFDENGCFLRFGSKKCLEEETCPQLVSLLNRTNRGTYDELAYDEVNSRIHKTFACIKKRPQLESERRELEKEVSDIEAEINDANENIETARRDLNDLLPHFTEEARKKLSSERANAIREIEKKEAAIARMVKLIDALCAAKNNEPNTREGSAALKCMSVDELEEVASHLRHLRTDIEYEISGICGLVTRIFGRRKITKRVIDAVAAFPREVRRYLYEIDSRDSLLDFCNCQDVVLFCERLQHGIELVVRQRKALNDIADAKGVIKRADKALATEESLSEYVQQVYQSQIAGRQDGIKKQIGELENFIARKNERCKVVQLHRSEVDSELDATNDLTRNIGDTGFGQKFVALALDHYLHMHDSDKAIVAYKGYLPDNIPWRGEDMARFSKSANKFLDVFRLVAVTSLSVKKSFPLTDGLFDLLVIDEASQCDVASALPLVMRAKQIVVIGDPKQLRHISKVNIREELAIKRHLELSSVVHLKYVESSLWDYVRYWLPFCGNDRPCMLENHYRCHSDIIGYSNEMFYSDLTFGGLRVCTPVDHGWNLPQGIIWKDVQGWQESETVNVNLKEVEISVEIATKFAKKSADVTIGIVTPFKEQAKKIDSRIPSDLRDRIVVDTAHRFQGDERDVMVYSLVVTTNSPKGKIRWIDSREPNLVNVAVTRARHLLIIVGNRDYIRAHSKTSLPLGHLVEYVRILEKRRGEMGHR